jgi:hypothetical protein
MSQGPFLSRTRVLFSRHACPVNMTRSKRVSDTCPTVWCPTRRIHDTRGGLDMLGDLVVYPTNCQWSHHAASFMFLEVITSKNKSANKTLVFFNF